MINTFLEKLKIWYDDVDNPGFSVCETGVYVRFKVGYRFVCNFEPCPLGVKNNGLYNKS